MIFKHEIFPYTTAYCESCKKTMEQTNIVGPTDELVHCLVTSSSGDSYMTVCHGCFDVIKNDETMDIREVDDSDKVELWRLERDALDLEIEPLRKIRDLLSGNLSLRDALDIKIEPLRKMRDRLNDNLSLKKSLGKKIEIKRYTRISETVEAIEFVGHNLRELAEFVRVPLIYDEKETDPFWITIAVSSGRFTICKYTWVVKDSSGEIYPVSSGVFEAKYREENGR